MSSKKGRGKVAESMAVVGLRKEIDVALHNLMQNINRSLEELHRFISVRVGSLLLAQDSLVAYLDEIQPGAKDRIKAIGKAKWDEAEAAAKARAEAAKARVAPELVQAAEPGPDATTPTEPPPAPGVESPLAE
jgi:hypothetical protein